MLSVSRHRYVGPLVSSRNGIILRSMKQPKAAASLIVTRACQYVAAYDTKLPGEVGRIWQNSTERPCVPGALRYWSKCCPGAFLEGGGVGPAWRMLTRKTKIKVLERAVVDVAVTSDELRGAIV